MFARDTRLDIDERKEGEASKKALPSFRFASLARGCVGRA